MDKYVDVQENIFFGQKTKHNNIPYLYTVSIYMIVLIGNHECRILMANHFGEDTTVEIQELTDRSNCGKCML